MSFIKWALKYRRVEPFFYDILFQDSERICYKHHNEILCPVALPQCDPSSNQLIHPCKEMCFDSAEACYNFTISMLHKLPLTPQQLKFKSARKLNGLWHS